MHPGINLITPSPEVPKGTFRNCKRSPGAQASPDFGSSPLQKAPYLRLSSECLNNGALPGDKAPADIYFSYCISGQIKSQFEFVSEFVSSEDTPGAEDVVQKPEFCPA